MPKKLPSDKQDQARRSPLARYLLHAFLDWQRASGETRSQLQFAEHLGLKRSTLTKLMQGRVEVPERDTVDAIAAKLGDGIYEALGMDKPDPLLQALIAGWGELSLEQQKTIARSAGLDVGFFIGRSDRRVADVDAGAKDGARTSRRVRTAGTA